MRHHHFLWALAACLVWLSQPIHAAAPSPYPLAGTGDPTTYIPRDVADAVQVLKTSLTKEDLQEIKEPSASGQFFLMGTGLRNSWGLWHDSRLAKWFEARGVDAPEDMSGIVFDALRADLKGEPFDVDKALKETHDGEMKAEEEAKQEKIRAVSAAAKIQTMMLGLKIADRIAPALRLPQLKMDDGTRVRYIAPFAGGFLIGGKHSDGNNDDDCHSPVSFLDLAKKTLHPVCIDGMIHTDGVVVLGDKAYFAGPTAGGHIIVMTDGHTAQPVPTPPGDGRLRLGVDGDHLLAIRADTVYRLDGGQWSLLVKTPTPIPWSLVPPARFGDRIYVRDEGRMEDDKRLWWIDLAAGGKLVSFDQDCGVVGPAGPRWENVWSYAVEPGGRLWVAAGFSLIRWDAAGGYHIALMNGATTFKGELVPGNDPAQTDTSWTLVTDMFKPPPLGICGMSIQPDGAMLLTGPQGFFRLSGHTITTLATFKKALPKNSKEYYSDDYKSPWDFTHLVPIAKDAWLLGDHWHGLFLLQRDSAGNDQCSWVDEKTGSPLAPDQLHLP